MVWSIFEILVNIYQGFLLTYFVYSFLSDKNDRVFIKSAGLIFSFILAGSITFLNSIMVFESFYTITYSIVLFVYALAFTKGTFLQKAFSAIYPNLIMGAASVLVSTFCSVVFNSSFENIVYINSLERVIAVIFTQLLMLYFINISLSAFKRSKKNLTRTEWSLIISVLLISILIYIVIYLISYEQVTNRGGIYLVLILTGIVFINIVVSYLVIEMSKKNEAVIENELLRVEAEYNHQYMSGMEIEHDAFKKLRHDQKNNYTVLYSLISNGYAEEALKLIEESKSYLNSSEIFIQTDNRVVNAVINAKFSAAKSLNIDITCVSTSKFIGISDIDLCRLLSNLIDNAINACQKCQTENKYIFLKISSDDYKFDVTIKNTIDKSVIKHNPFLKSTALNPNEHGYGTKIIADIANKYNGRIDYYEEELMFCCHVILKTHNI